MTKLQDVILRDTLANRPSAGTAGRLFYDTTNSILYRDNGSSWDNVESAALTDPMTTRGDIIVRNSSNVTARLAVGSANRVFKSDGTDPAWGQVTEAMQNITDVTTGNVSTTAHGYAPKAPNDATKYLDGTGAYTVPAGGGGYTTGARAYNSGNLTISHNTSTVLTYNSERYDTDTIHDTSSNTSRLTCKTAGKYLIISQIAWASNTSGRRYMNIKLNGTTQIVASEFSPPANSVGLECQLMTIYDLSVNDYVETEVYQSSGGNLDVVASANHSPEFMMSRVG